MYLTVPIPESNRSGQKGGPVYLQECIEKFIEEEILDGEDAWYALFSSRLQVIESNCCEGTVPDAKFHEEQLRDSQLPSCLLFFLSISNGSTSRDPFAIRLRHTLNFRRRKQFTSFRASNSNLRLLVLLT
jgi:hypothetical protein